MGKLDDLYQILETTRKARGLSQHETVRRALGMKGNSALQNIRRGFDPGYTSVAALCRELGLELYVGPPRHDGAIDYSGAPVILAQPASPLPSLLRERLHLPEGATEADALAALDRLSQTGHEAMRMNAALAREARAFAEQARVMTQTIRTIRAVLGDEQGDADGG